MSWVRAIDRMWGVVVREFGRRAEAAACSVFGREEGRRRSSVAVFFVSLSMTIGPTSRWQRNQTFMDKAKSYTFYLLMVVQTLFVNKYFIYYHALLKTIFLPLSKIAINK